MIRYASIFLLGLIIVTASYQIFFYNDSPPARPIPDETILGENLGEDEEHIINFNNNRLYIVNKTTGLSQTVSISEESLMLVKVISDKPENEPPFIDRNIKKAYILKGEKLSYLVEIKPETKISLTYPNVDVEKPYIIISKSENKLYFYDQGELVKRYKVATGEKPDYTPEGIFVIDNKTKYPGGKDEHAPMGSRWMGLKVPCDKDKRGNKDDGGPDSRAPKGDKYGIHGTNDESTIGTHQSGGCIRMYNKSINELYDMVEIGTKVRIIK
ncbi:hypothetical protein SYNTR_0155 [Candidatus Syntrophocurvum alkaliphilum]|uniref:L,D-TPase catalytic domain-containing protein n=1 Tax=Candidatus Syntrophocurvum alkaliphilum TaxID=2293317 RepID=A0A6I6DDR7_9FIRM|nr:L,D-transpeptidase family protein [Candidatus Syntrophocurvum alkaliphilum]QGT98748.1 hypothetical protein SYNTR_0155 [Candidatus Syntrophocurvum alkaliphilum]